MEIVIFIFLLGAAMIDLRCRYIPNWYIAVNFIYLSVIYIFGTGVMELGPLLIRLFLFQLIGVGVYFFRLLGAADIKLFIVLACFLDTANMTTMIIVSFVMFLVGGLYRGVRNREIMNILCNVKSCIRDAFCVLLKLSGFHADTLGACIREMKYENRYNQRSMHTFPFAPSIFTGYWFVLCLKLGGFFVE